MSEKMKIDHIGYLSENIEKSIKIFEQLGYQQISEVIRDDQPGKGSAPRNVFLCFLENEGLRVELVSPIDEKSDVYQTLQRQGEGPYHICYQTADLDRQLEEMRSAGWLLVKEPEQAVAFDHARVAFLFKRGIGLIEMVEVFE